MNYYTLEELKAKILSQLDIIQFLDALDISFAEILNRFDEEIKDNYETIVSTLGEQPYL